MNNDDDDDDDDDNDDKDDDDDRTVDTHISFCLRCYLVANNKDGKAIHTLWPKHPHAH
jgi:hypothetical protein